MATESESLVEEVDFSDVNLPLLEENWFPSLALTFLVVTVFRVLRAVGIVTLLHRWLVLLSTLITAAGRARRAERFKLAAELTDLRAKLKTINMVDNFAQYSRCERRIKALERQLAQSRPETFSGSVFRTVGINVFLFVLEGILIAWLIARAPTKTVSSRNLELAELQESYFLPLLYVIQHVPSKLFMIFWVGLCHSAAKPLTCWIQTFLSSSPEGINTADLDGSFEQQANNCATTPG